MFTEFIAIGKSKDCHLSKTCKYADNFEGEVGEEVGSRKHEVGRGKMVVGR
jgi:hypothetical protein